MATRLPDVLYSDSLRVDERLAAACPPPPIKLQNVFLVMDPGRVKHFRWTIHQAQRIGTSGRRLIVNPQCQIYEPYFDNYRVLTSLWEITGNAELIPPPFKPCGHCFKDVKILGTKDYQIASISHNLR